MSDTPRTDTKSVRFGTLCAERDQWWVSREIARQLERELAAANERIRRLEEDSRRLDWLLARGLAWRDCYNTWWLDGEWLYDTGNARDIIDQAKETKP